MSNSNKPKNTGLDDNQWTFNVDDLKSYFNEKNINPITGGMYNSKNFNLNNTRKQSGGSCPIMSNGMGQYNFNNMGVPYGFNPGASSYDVSLSEIPPMSNFGQSYPRMNMQSYPTMGQSFYGGCGYNPNQMSSNLNSGWGDINSEVPYMRGGADDTHPDDESFDNDFIVNELNKKSMTGGASRAKKQSMSELVSAADKYQGIDSDVIHGGKHRPEYDDLLNTIMELTGADIDGAKLYRMALNLEIMKKNPALKGVGNEDARTDEIKKLLDKNNGKAALKVMQAKTLPEWKQERDDYAKSRREASNKKTPTRGGVSLGSERIRDIIGDEE